MSESGSPALADGLIVFGRWDEAIGDFEVYTIDANGQNEHLLIEGPHEIPRWSPDGTQVSITAMVDDQVVPAVVNADGSGYRELVVDVPTLSLGCAAWTPDGGQLACEGWSDADPDLNGIYLISVGPEATLERVTSAADGFHDIPRQFLSNGERLAFVRASPDFSEAANFIVELDGSDSPAVKSDPDIGAVSPDGTRRVYDRGGTLLVVAVDGGSAPVKVTEISSVAFWDPAWSPDGEWIVCSGSHDGQADIYRMRADGSAFLQLTDAPANEEFANWAPGS